MKPAASFFAWLRSPQPCIWCGSIDDLHTARDGAGPECRDCAAWLHDKTDKADKTASVLSAIGLAAMLTVALLLVAHAMTVLLAGTGGIR